MGGGEVERRRGREEEGMGKGGGEVERRGKVTCGVEKGPGRSQEEERSRGEEVWSRGNI